MTGFRVASDSIKQVENPGLNASIRALGQLKIATEMVKLENTKDAEDIEEYAKSLGLLTNLASAEKTLFAGSMLDKGRATETTPEAPDQDVKDAVELISKADSSINTLLQKIRAEIESNFDFSSAQTTEAKTKLLKELKLQPSQLFNTNASFPDSNCKTKIINLQKSINNAPYDHSLATTESAKNQINVGLEKNKAELSATIKHINNLASSYVKLVAGEVEKIKRDYDALMAAAQTEKGDIANNAALDAALTIAKARFAQTATNTGYALNFNSTELGKLPDGSEGKKILEATEYKVAKDALETIMTRCPTPTVAG